MNKKIHEKSKNHWTMTIWTNLVGIHQRHIPIKFEVNLADHFGEEVKNVNNPITIHFAIPIDLHSNQ